MGYPYLIVETGGWLSGRPVLISPISIVDIDWAEKRLDVSLTKKQVEMRPPIDRHLPVFRQHEAAYLGYYGYPLYWNGPNLWVRRSIRLAWWKRPAPPKKRWPTASAKNRLIRIYAVPKLSSALTWKQSMVKSAM